MSKKSSFERSGESLFILALVVGDLPEAPQAVRKLAPDQNTGKRFINKKWEAQRAPPIS
jgi:hypothetical protein